MSDETERGCGAGFGALLGVALIAGSLLTGVLPGALLGAGVLIFSLMTPASSQHAAVLAQQPERQESGSTTALWFLLGVVGIGALLLLCGASVSLGK